MKRKCSLCREPIDQCMGFQRSDHFVEFLEGKRKPEYIEEICGKCDIKNYLKETQGLE